MYKQIRTSNTLAAKSGFSLIEALFAMTLIGIVIASIAPVFASYTNVNRQTEIRSDATLVGERLLDDLRQIDIGNWPDSSTVRQTTISGRTFDATLTYQLFDSNISSNLTQVRVEVTFNGTTYFTAQTVFTNL